MIPGGLKTAAPELAEVRAFLDVGTGVGLFAIAACGAWPGASVAGIDVWEPTLQAARANVRAADLDDRVTIREQNVLDLEEVESYDCAWLPTFFVTETVLHAALPRLYRALEPDGWLVLGRMAPPADRLRPRLPRCELRAAEVPRSMATICVMFWNAPATRRSGYCLARVRYRSSMSSGGARRLDSHNRVTMGTHSRLTATPCKAVLVADTLHRSLTGDVSAWSRPQHSASLSARPA